MLKSYLIFKIKLITILASQGWGLQTYYYKSLFQIIYGGGYLICKGGKVKSKKGVKKREEDKNKIYIKYKKSKKWGIEWM